MTKLQGRTPKQRADNLEASGIGCMGIIFSILLAGMLWAVLAIVAWWAAR
jgi:hypothetical protein